MGRGRSSSGGSRGSSSSGGSRGFSSGSRGRSTSSFSSSRWRSTPTRSTVIIGGYNSGNHHRSVNSGIAPLIFMAIIFLLFGLFPFVMGTSIIVKANKYSSVQAVCIDNNYSGGWYYTTYEYTVKGIEYENESMNYIKEK